MSLAAPCPWPRAFWVRDVLAAGVEDLQGFAPVVLGFLRERMRLVRCGPTKLGNLCPLQLFLGRVNSSWPEALILCFQAEILCEAWS